MTSQHDWELSKENAAPLECGRSTKSLSKRAFGTSSAEMIAIEEKTKKYEKLVRRSEKAVEWLQKQVKEITTAAGGDPNRELTKEEADHLRERMTSELGFDPSTPDRDHLDYDPMRYWVLYIKHVRESYPSDSQKQFLIMERCARTFMYRPFLNPAYQNDIRFIRTCILYADKTSNPSEVFKLMSKIKVGTLTALFWVAWAWVAEKAEDFQFTEKIFQKALSVGAEPKKFLEERQKQFLRRMSRHWLNASQANEDNLEGDDDEDGRGALSSISSVGLAANNRGTGFNRNGSRDRQHQTQRSRQLSRINENNSAGFSIFQDNDENAEDVLNDDDEDGAQRRRQLAKESERVKENRMRPESWNERGYGLKNPALAVETPMASDSIVGTAHDGAGRQTSSSFAAAPFEVFVDDDCCDDDNREDNDLSSKKVDNRSLRQRLDGGTAERLARDPLRYMKNPSKMESDHRKYEPKSDDRRDIIERGETENVNNKRPEKQTIKATKSGSSDGGGYDKELLKADSSGHECCFEEIRLERRYYNLVSSDENFNFLKQDSSNDENETSQMDVETSIEDEDMEECTAEFDEHLAQLIEKPKSGMLKSSLRSGMKTRTLEPPSNGSTRKVLFGANTNVEYKNNNESLNTTSGSSQLNGSFVRAEETINTKLANAEISMMFCSPNANVSRVESPGKPLFSSSRNNFNDEINDTSNVASFAIHDDNQDNVAGGFSIFQDDADNDSKSKGPPHDAEDTASHSLLGDVLTGLDSSPADSKPAAPSRKMVPSMRRPSLPSKSKSIIGSQQKETRRDSGEDTASLSVIGGVLGGIDSCHVDESPKKTSAAGFSIFSDENTHSPKDSKPKSCDGGLSFAIYSDEIGESAAKKPKIWNDSENVCPEPSFGDISRIDDALDNERTRTNNLQLSEEYSKLKSKGSLLSAIEYTMEHRKSTETALRLCMKAAMKSHPGFSIFDHRGKPLPKALLRKSFPSGTNVDFLGGESATIINELGRGVYGVVLLVDVSSEESNKGSQRRALKIQAPIGSLAHEYSLLLEVEERVQPDPSGFYPFPRSEALFAFSQGGLFMMTAGSESGMNLIDVANTYKKIMGNVPELIAIYYTSRMLRHLESLHNEGKVLHCDVKPDNWVLTSSKAGDAVRGCDLMLVDFGRAIDLEKVTRQGENPLQTLFKGSIAAEDMECGKMREGLPWGVDLDYFGLCASAFILLFGSHMEVVRDNSTGNWRLNKVLRRYWQKDLWQSLFHSLLNFDLGSERKCLRDLRVAFDEYIDEDRSREIATHLNQLFTHLPKKR